MKKSVIVILFFILSLITLISLGIAIYSYRQVQSGSKNTVNKEDPDALMLETIASMMVLPREKPTIVTITDREKLQDQEFFKRAQNGDKVIIYESIRRVFLYRPSLNKIVDVAPLVFTGQQAATASAGNVSPAPTRIVQKDASPSSGSLGVEEQGNFKL